MPELHRISLFIDPDESGEEAIDILSAILAVRCAHGWEERILPTGEVCCVAHSAHEGFISELEEAARGVLPGIRIEKDVIEEENWAMAWKEFFTPVLGGEHFIVLAPWMEKERAETNKTPILIEPKMAFGTGHHETTALCLDALSRLFAKGRVISDSYFLDLGTGSGILGIGAALLGLSGEGLDIDISAVDNAIENRELNKIPPEQFTLSRGGIEEANGKYDLVLANILAGPLKEMAADIVATLKKNSILVLSGILDIQAESVIQAYVEQGLPAPERFGRGEWVCLVFSQA